MRDEFLLPLPSTLPTGDGYDAMKDGVVCVFVRYRYDPVIGAGIARGIVAKELGQHIKNAFAMFTDDDSAQIDYVSHELAFSSEETSA